MGNSLGCSASGERLVSAARDGDFVEAKMLLHCSPYLSRYSTFGGLNSPLHFAAAKGHNQIVVLLLDNGADVNFRNYCGQTALMQACRYGHWEIIQTLLLFGCNVTRADYLSGRTAIHFAAVNGHARCIRLVLADFVPSTLFESTNVQRNGGKASVSRDIHKNNRRVLSKFVNKAADGGVTALHMAALNGFFDCVQLLLDLHADGTAVTFQYGTSMDLIGAGSNPLHYAACGGNLKCCQILLAKGASCLTVNSNGWVPLDVAKMWGRNWLEPLLDPNSEMAIPLFPPSNYLSLPLMSILIIARECGLESSTASSDDINICAVCLERSCSVAAQGCRHELCVRCALYLCSTSNTSSGQLGLPGSVPCPLCRHGIVSFLKLPGTPLKQIKPPLCNTPCLHHHQSSSSSLSTSSSSSSCTTQEIRKNRLASSSSTSDLFCPVACISRPFPSSAARPLCTDDDDDEDEPCPNLTEEDYNDSSHAVLVGPQSGAGRVRLGKTASCSSMLWAKRSYTREQQCNSEINT